MVVTQCLKDPPNSPQENGQKMTIDMLQYIGHVKPDVSKPFSNFVHYKKSVELWECSL